MVTSKYKLSDLGLTLKVEFIEKMCWFVIQTNKDINGCLTCDVITPGATIKLRAKISNKFVSNYIVHFPDTSKYFIYIFLLLYITYSSCRLDCHNF